MKLSHILALTSLVLIGCNQAPGNDTGQNSSMNERPLAGEGEFCGGIAVFECEAGLTCVYDGNYPDAGGTCE